MIIELINKKGGPCLETWYLICTAALMVPLAFFVVILALSLMKNDNAKLERLATICCAALFLISIPRLFFAIKTEQNYIFLHWVIIFMWIINTYIHWNSYNNYRKKNENKE